MLKRILLFTVFTVSVNGLYAQKQVIDTAAFRNWPDIVDPKISNDGQYVAYAVASKQTERKTLHVVSSFGTWNFTLNDVRSYDFSNNNKAVYFLKGQDSLGVMNLKNKRIIYTSGISSYQISKKGNWVAYLSKDANQRLAVKNYVTKKTTNFQNVTDYRFSEDGETLVVRSIPDTLHVTSASLTWMDLTNGKADTVWKGINLANWDLDHKHSQMAFADDPCRRYRLCPCRHGDRELYCHCRQRRDGGYRDDDHRNRRRRL